MASVQNSILEVVVARLETVANIRNVVRPKRINDFLVTDKVAAVTHTDAEKNDELSCPGAPARIAWDFSISVACIIAPDDGDVEPIDKRADEFGVLCYNAITAPSSWWEFGGHALVSDIGSISNYKPADESAHGVTFMINVTFRAAEGAIGVSA